MSDLAIQVKNLSKRYRIGINEEKPETLVAAATSWLRSPVTNYRKLRRLSQFRDDDKDGEDIIWALQDISLEVTRGDVIGVIGPNGAGKTTLLKILSRITQPTSGQALINGRVSSLLEVGTGFHPELTGRENIFLNGTLLGMTRQEVGRKFDEIVDFSGVEKFIDTPVKRFSSGMRMRLAFSVAAHLEPEILLIDEVLAVGDAEFQKKCLGKMDDVSKEGRTILFVSHYMAAINQLCERSILLRDGQIEMDGVTRDVVATYLNHDSVDRHKWERPQDMTRGSDLRLNSAQLLPSDIRGDGLVSFDKGFSIAINYEITSELRDVAILARLIDGSGNIVLTTWDTDTTGLRGQYRTPGAYVSTCKIPGNLLRPGPYLASVGALIDHMNVLDFHERALSFEISSVGYNLNHNRVGIVAPLLEWDVLEHESEMC